jgi:phosphomannomutase
MMAEPIFTISGLRGIIGKDLTPELACRVAAGFGTFTGPGRIALGRDCRSSGEMLFHAVAAGLMSAGCEVLDCGICPTPTIPLLVREEKLGGGIEITASHNPPEWNGLKFVASRAAFLNDKELAELKRIVARQGALSAGWDRLGRVVARDDAIDIHIRRILQSDLFRNRPRRKLKIGIDACNGAASLAAEKTVQELGSTAYALFCSVHEGGCFPRRPEPVPGHLAELGKFVRDKGLDLGIAFDPDGDRFSAVDETGLPLGEEATVILAVDFVLRQTRGPVVVNLSTTRGVDDIAGRYGVEVIRSRVGEAAVVAKMAEVGAVVGGEGNGGVIIPAINTSRDGMVALAMLVQTISDAGQSLSAISRNLPRYVMVKDKATIGRRSWTAKRKALGDAFPGMARNLTDGIKLSGKGDWLHVRMSNTEPIVRLIAEARTETEARRLIARAKKVLQDSNTKTQRHEKR